MRIKVFTILFFGFVAVFLLPLKAFSQGSDDTEFDVAYKEYKLSIEPYQNLHDDYILKRAQYLRFKTQKSRDDAFDATLKMLHARNDVVVAYLEALRYRLKEADGVDDAAKEEVYVEINTETSWYEAHRKNLESALTLDDLVNDSQEAKSIFARVESVAYKVLSLVSYGEFFLLSERMDIALSDLGDKHEEIKTEDREDYQFSADKLQVIDRWMVDSSNHITRSREKKNEALNMIVGALAPKTFNLRSYNSVLSKLEESRLILRESSTFLKEVIRQIKTKEDYEQ